MRILVLTKIKDTVEGVPTSFEVGDACTVNDKDGARFVTHGWAQEAGSAAAPASGSNASVDLDIHKGVLGSTSTL